MEKIYMLLEDKLEDVISDIIQKLEEDAAAAEYFKAKYGDIELDNIAGLIITDYLWEDKVDYMPKLHNLILLK